MDITDKKRAYWTYQYRLGKDYLIPFLAEWGIAVSGRNILDIGCAEGGQLCAFAENGARGIGLDISVSRLQIARRLAKPEHLEQITFVAADFHFSPFNWKDRKPDLILLRDVLEHLPDKKSAVKKLADLMGQNSILFITFPPFYAPFGGHQQMLGGMLRRVPYFHTAPEPIWKIFRWLITRFDPNPRFLSEMEKLRRHRISIRLFKKLVRQNGLRILRERLYVSRPSYHLRFGWPIVEAKFLSKIPILREWLVSGAFFLLQRETA